MPRLDSYLFSCGMVKSRTNAGDLIKEGKVSVNGKIITKPSYDVKHSDKVQITGDMPKFVSRGGLKLEKAIEEFSLDLKGCTCMDIGASTGGFTDCMLSYGAVKVFAVDVGTDQLDSRLKQDIRVISMEKTNVRGLDPAVIEKVDFISIDVSFISLKAVLPCAYSFLKDNGHCVALIKPQFEAGKTSLNKKGIVKDEKIRKRVCDDISAFALSIGFKPGKIITSPITGKDGNIEFLISLSK